MLILKLTVPDDSVENWDRFIGTLFSFKLMNLYVLVQVPGKCDIFDIFWSDKSTKEKLREFRCLGQSWFPSLRLEFMRSFNSWNVNKPTAMHVNSIPAVFAEHLEQYFRPFFEGLFIRNDQLQVKRKAEIKLMTDSALLFMHKDRGNRMRDTLQAIKFQKLLFCQLRWRILFRQFSIPVIGQIKLIRNESAIIKPGTFICQESLSQIGFLQSNIRADLGQRKMYHCR
jgi:hypothetical protein